MVWFIKVLIGMLFSLVKFLVKVWLKWLIWVLDLISVVCDR